MNIFNLFKSSQKTSQKGLERLADSIMPTLSRLEKLHANEVNISGLPTGFKILDLKTSGLHPAELIIIAARPSMGKTAFALNIAENVAVEHKKPVAIFSLEMSKDALLIRLLSSIARVGQGRLKSGRYNTSDRAKLTAAAEKISEAPIYVDDDAFITVVELSARKKTCGGVKSERESAFSHNNRLFSVYKRFRIGKKI
jgi:replicative DNA helicase